MNYREKIKFIKDNIRYRSCTPDDIYIGNVLERMENDKNFNANAKWNNKDEMEAKRYAITYNTVADWYENEILKERIFKSAPLEEQSSLCLELIIEAIKI